MPWNEVSVMDQRREFIRLALQEGANRRELFRRFGISPEVGYKWLARWQAGDHELADRSRRSRVMTTPGVATKIRRRKSPANCCCLAMDEGAIYAFIAAAVIGNARTRAPQALKIALPIAGAITVTASWRAA